MFKAIKKAIVLLMLCCVGLVVMDCSGQVKQKNVNNSTDYKVIKQTYTDRKVTINYPQVTDMSENKKQEEINEIIKTEALSVASGYSDLDSVSININYEIKRQSAGLLSIIYSGLRNPKGTAHPTHEFYTTNINMHEGNKLRLKDVINIDDSFVKKVYNGKVITVSSAIPLESLKSYENERLKQGLQAGDVKNYLENKIGVFSYFTEDSLGISTHVSHLYGDHVEWELKYQDIVDNIKAENEVSKSFF